MHFNLVEVSLNTLAVLFKILSEYCEYLKKGFKRQEYLKTINIYISDYHLWDYFIRVSDTISK